MFGSVLNTALQRAARFCKFSFFSGILKKQTELSVQQNVSLSYVNCRDCLKNLQCLQHLTENRKKLS